MPISAEQQAAVDRAEALLTGLSDEDKREVVRLAYVTGEGKTLEDSVGQMRTRHEARKAHTERVFELASRVGIVLEQPDSVDRDIQNLVRKWGKATVQTALDSTT